jgi:putative NADH-flavin reductase
MKIAIIGASQGIGLKLLELAISNDHEVTAMLRNPSKLTINHSKLEIIKGDILDHNSLKKVIAGKDAICVSIGIPPSIKPVFVFSEGIKNVIDAMIPELKQKLIVITGIGAGESKGHGGFLYDRLFQPLLLKEIYKDKDRSESIIMSSNTNWQIVRPGFLTNGPLTEKYRVIDYLNGVVAGKISRIDVAHYILNEINTPTHFGKTPLITY